MCFYVNPNCLYAVHVVVFLSTHSDKGGISGRGDFAYGPGYGMGGGGGGYGGYGPPGRGEWLWFEVSPVELKLENDV